MKEADSFYSRLRERKKDCEIQKPLKLKLHSSLERVLDTYKERKSIDFDNVYFNDYSLNESSILPL